MTPARRRSITGERRQTQRSAGGAQSAALPEQHVGQHLRQRGAGVLLHLTSLPGPFGSGDLGPEAYSFADGLARGGFRYWQMLPVNPVDENFCPYASSSSFASEPGLISPTFLNIAGLLKSSEITKAHLPSGRQIINHKKVLAARENLLRIAFARWSSARHSRREFAEFCAAEAEWLEDFAQHQTFATQFGRDWTQWPNKLRDRDRATLRQATAEHINELDYVKFVQWQFAKQWRQLRTYCLRRGIRLIGDLPIFVDRLSADVWAHRDLFHLDRRGQPSVVSGVPPDHFFKTGQKWGHPLYDWSRMDTTGYRWWTRRIARLLDQFDIVRIDHFIGLYRFWKVPVAARNAMRGSWGHAKGAELFHALAKADNALPFIAEDLGLVIPEVHALRDAFNLPGMRVAQFGFSDSNDASYHLPHHYPPVSVVYPGTHDNAPIKGWFADLVRQSRKHRAACVTLDTLMSYFGETQLKNIAVEIHHRIITACMQSQSNTVIVALQDLLGLGNEARMNVPGVAKGNWRWRATSLDLRHFPWEKWRHLLAATERIAAERK